MSDRYSVPRRRDLVDCNSQVAETIVQNAWEEMVKKDVRTGSDDAAVIFRLTFEEETEGLPKSRKLAIYEAAAERVRTFVYHVTWLRQL